MIYDKLISELKKRGLPPSKVINVDEGHDRRIVGLHVDVSPLQRGRIEPTIRELCGNEFTYHWIGNGGNYFFITAKAAK